MTYHKTDAVPEDILTALWKAGLKAVAADQVLPAFLPPPPSGSTHLLAFGKAAGAMAATALHHRSDIKRGLVITPGGEQYPLHECGHIDRITATHPLPDTEALAAAEAAFALCEDLTEEDQLLALVSGGGSSLLCAPAKGLDLHEKRTIIDQLMRGGASISEINCVRRHLSGIKGGRLAAATKATVVTLAISDVAGNAPEDIASGPTVPDPTTKKDACTILKKHQIESPKILMDTGSSDSDSVELAIKNDFHIVASAQHLLDGAKTEATRKGINTIILANDMEGNVLDLAQQHLEAIRKHLANRNGNEPFVLLPGGEATTTIRDQKGEGGPNQEFILQLALLLHEAGIADRVIAIACDTDGKDGNAPAAGALYSSQRLKRANVSQDQIRKALGDHASFSLLNEADCSIITGPTYTNVNDFRAIFVL